MPRRKIKPKRGLTSRQIEIAVLIAVAFLICLPVIGFGVAAGMEEHDSFCGSCHTQPESSYLSRQQSAPVDLASVHFQKQSKCIDCHSGLSTNGRIQAIMEGGGNAVAFFTHTAHQPGKLKHPYPDMNCIKCHTDVPQTQEFNLHFHAFLAKWQSLDPNAARCISCHPAHASGRDSSTGFMDQQQVEAVCQQCHQALGGG